MAKPKDIRKLTLKQQPNDPEGTYTITATCSNCRYGDKKDETPIKFEIPKGVSTQEFFDKRSCPNCGCTSLSA